MLIKKILISQKDKNTSFYIWNKDPWHPQKERKKLAIISIEARYQVAIMKNGKALQNHAHLNLNLKSLNK